MSFLFCLFALIVYAVLKGQDRRYKEEQEERHTVEDTERKKLEAMIEADREYMENIGWAEAEKRLTEPMFKKSWFLVTEAVYSLYGKVYAKSIIGGNFVIPYEERKNMSAKLIWINNNLKRFGVEGYVYVYSDNSWTYSYPDSASFNPNRHGEIMWEPIARSWNKKPL